jgi:hypothetical protein
MSSSTTLWGLVTSALTHPAVRMVQENVPRADFVEFVPIMFGIYIRISELCTFISDRIDQQHRCLFSVIIYRNITYTQEGSQWLSHFT